MSLSSLLLIVSLPCRIYLSWARCKRSGATKALVGCFYWNTFVNFIDICRLYGLFSMCLIIIDMPKYYSSCLFKAMHCKLCKTLLRYSIFSEYHSDSTIFRQIFLSTSTRLHSIETMALIYHIFVLCSSNCFPFWINWFCQPSHISWNDDSRS